MSDKGLEPAKATNPTKAMSYRKATSCEEIIIKNRLYYQPRVNKGS